MAVTIQVEKMLSPLYLKNFDKKILEVLCWEVIVDLPVCLLLMPLVMPVNAN